MDDDPQSVTRAPQPACADTPLTTSSAPQSAAGAAFDVFISYSHADAVAAQGLWAALTAAGLRAWKDDREIRSGDR
jgi:hypothetical protein